MAFSKTLILVAVSTAIVIFSGCNADPATDASNGQSKPAKQPKFAFHQPKELKSAVDRIRTIHDSLISDKPIEPLVFEYVELIHGEGAAAHSHYYLASDFQSNSGAHDHHEDDHGDVEETTKRGQVEVDFQTELKDLMRWLPDIAAKSDLGESDWNVVNDAAGQFQKIIAAIGADSPEPEFRKAWQTRKDEISDLIGQLSKAAMKSAGESP